MKFWAYMKKEFEIELSYKTSFVMKYVSILSSAVIYFFISKIVKTDYIKINYFMYVIIGAGSFSFLRNVMTAASNAIRREELEGTFEWMYSAFGSIFKFSIFSTLAKSAIAFIDLIFYVAAVPLIFGQKLYLHYILSLFLILLLLALFFFALGLLSTAYLLCFKKGNPLNWFVSFFFLAFGEVLFPKQVIPHVLQNLINWFPLSYFLGIIRGSLTLNVLSLDFQKVMLYLIETLIVFLVSLFILKKAEKYAKKTGSFLYY